MNDDGPRNDVRTFENKVASLIAATRSLDIPQILTVRRLTLADPESRRWATDRQLAVVFTVILGKAIERWGLSRLRESRDQDFADLLAASGAARDDDHRILADLATQMLGSPAAKTEAVKTEAGSTQAAFQSLMEQAATPPPARSPRTLPPVREPPPLFAAQLGPSPERRMAAIRSRAVAGGGAAETGAPPGRVDFNHLFDDTVCAYAQKSLALFRVGAPARGARLPFLLSPEFGQAYRETLRRFVLPQIRATRHMQTLAQSYNWDEVGSDKLIEIIQGSEVNNPILHNWDARWAALRPNRLGKGRKPEPLRPEDDPWPLLREDATRYNYEPPTEEHIPLLRDVLRFEVEAIAKCWRELSQLYEQEFAPTGRQDQAREGALRDGVTRWVAKLPEHIGEHLAIKALFEFEKLDAMWLRRLFASFGRNESERRRVAPFLSDFLMQMSGY